MFRIGSLVAVLVGAALCLPAQEFRATVSGSVTDPSGAAIPSVRVVAKEVRTGTTSQATSDSAGQYTIPFLLPGEYEVDAENAGFQSYARKGVRLGSGDHPVIDIQLQVGQQSQTVSVTADVPLINTANASTGQTITTKQVEDLPVNGRTPLALAQLSIGVIPEGQPSLVRPFDNAGATNISIAGSKIQAAEILMDGSPDTTWDQRVAFNPPMDAVQQVTVDIFDTDAAFGHTSAGTANQITKSGTNTVHGTAYEFNQNNFTSANNFFSNASGKPVPVLHFNQYGLTFGAPVVIPKVFNGRNKLFTFFAWEGLKSNTPTPITTTVPTAAERGGDFSALLALSPTYQIYNPFMAVQTGTTITRPGFSGNQIPSNLLNKVAQAYLNLYPLPNQAGLPNGQNNYFVNGPSIDTFDSEFGRLDYNIGNNDKLFFDFRHNNRFQDKNNLFNNIATGSTLGRENFGSSVDEVHTFGGSTVLDVRLNWTRMNEFHGEPSAGYNPTGVGFPEALGQNSEHIQLPNITFGSCGTYTSVQCLGDTAANTLPSETYQIFGTLEKVIGPHSLKFGADTRRYNLSNITYGAASGTFAFATGYTQRTNTGNTASPFGQDFASFLLGLPTSGSYNEASYAYLRSYYTGLFIQDDWRIRKNLTINLGLRFEQETDTTERYGRVENGFNTTSSNPVAGAAQAAYATNYAANPALFPFPPSSFGVNGGLTFASPSNPSYYNVQSHPFSPRIGFSWSPEMFHDKTVFRGGYGIFVAPLFSSALTTISPSGSISTTPLVNQEGFSQSTPITTNGFQNPNLAGAAPVSTLTNPFPNGILQPSGSSLGLATFNGQSIGFLAPKLRNPYSQRWQFDIQQQLPLHVLFEIAYIGNRTNHVVIGQTELNAIPRQYLSTSKVADTNIGYLNAQVANPFYKLLPNSSYNGATVARSQLLSPYPQFPAVTNGGSLSGGVNGVLMQNNTAGSSWFNSLNVRIEKRYSNGLSLLTNYAWSNFMEQDDYLNDSDTRLETRVSPYDHPHHIAVGFSYNFPIGKGKAVDLRNRVADALLGGWLVNGIVQWEIGAPIYWSANVPYCSTPSPACNGFGGPLNLNSANGNGLAFNLQSFDRVAADQPTANIRTFATTYGNLRLQNLSNLDASLLKNFNLNETRYFQLRFEAFNALNHPTFAAPNVSSPASSTFGLVQTQANSPRAIQLGARFVF